MYSLSATAAATWCPAAAAHGNAAQIPPLGSGFGTVVTAAFAVDGTCGTVAATGNVVAPTGAPCGTIGGIAGTCGVAASFATAGGTATTTHLFACALVRKCGRLMRANQVV